MKLQAVVLTGLLLASCQDLIAERNPHKAHIAEQLAAADATDQPVRVIEYQSSPNGKSSCGTAQIGRVRITTFVVSEEAASSGGSSPLVILQPSIDLAQDKERARSEVLTNAIRIHQECRRLGLALPFHARD
ncbi:MAG TPA: hypothetical protein VEA79_10270 [Phenylobacterium sp.]|nr:hypothetical protein [Phenylobacterium sp.]